MNKQDDELAYKITALKLNGCSGKPNPEIHVS